MPNDPQAYDSQKEGKFKTQASDKYIENCKKFEIPVDPSVVISLQTEWDILQPSKYFREGAMLPLLGILDQNEHVSYLNLSTTSMNDNRFRGSGNGNSNARILNAILSSNTKIQKLNLSYTGLNDFGLKEICESIQKNTSIQELNISSNHFGESGVRYLISALERNTSIKSIDISCNALGFRIISALKCSCVSRSINLHLEGNFVFEEVLNAVTHGLGFLFAILGANVLISDASSPNLTPYHYWACVIYSFSLISLFLFSCLFHSSLVLMLPGASKILLILDHVGIYLTIAGSYTPILMISLHHSSSAQILLIMQWVCAFCGSAFAACRSDLHPSSNRNIELAFFLIMGLGIAPFIPTLLDTVNFPTIFLLALGGACYVSGIIFFILGKSTPIYHVVWHVFVIVAAASHWFSIYLFIIRTDLGQSYLDDSAGLICSGAHNLNEIYKQCLVGNSTQAATTAISVLAQIQQGVSARRVLQGMYGGLTRKI